MFGIRITNYNAIGKPVSEERFYAGWTVDKICNAIRGITGKQVYDLKTKGFIQCDYEGQKSLFEIVERDAASVLERKAKHSWRHQGTISLDAPAPDWPPRVRGMERSDYFGRLPYGLEGVAEIRTLRHASSYEAN